MNFVWNWLMVVIKKFLYLFDFVDWEITKDSLQNKACSNQWKIFSQYVDFHLNFIELEPWSKIQKTGQLLFPLWYSGEINWCFVYMVPDSKKIIEQSGSFFDILVRKANFIDGYVVWEFKRALLLDTGSIDFYTDSLDSSLVVLLPFKNKWFVPEFLQFTWLLLNSLGYERFVTSSKIIQYWTSSVVEFRFADIPFYKGLYRFSFQWLSVLDTKLDLSYIAEENKIPLNFFYKKNIILVPWILLFWIIWFFIVLFVLRLILRKLLKR